MGRRLIPERELSRRGPLWKPPRKVAPSCCISSPFGELSTTRGLITYVLLTRAPLYRGRSPFSLDLHVLGAPLTFVLSQDQTLQFESCRQAGWFAPSLAASFFHFDIADQSRLWRMADVFGTRDIYRRIS